MICTADVAQLVEHHLAKVRVAGSNPVVRSRGDKCCIKKGIRKDSFLFIDLADTRPSQHAGLKELKVAEAV